MQPATQTAQALDPDEPTVRHPREPAKVTARMLQIRELIDQGEYPDLDQLAETIAAAATKP